MKNVDDIYYLMAFVLLLAVGAGLWRVAAGPSPADRMLAVQLAGTGTVAAVLLLSEAAELEALVDVALVFALLAAVTLIAFVKVGGLPPAPPARGSDD